VAISGNQWQSYTYLRRDAIKDIIRGHQWSSEAIRGQYAYTTASAEARAR
jgi:hypothetical protein